MMTMTLLATVVALAVAAILTWRFCQPVSRFHILDYPNERSLHARPIPRSGGVAVLAGIAAGGMVLYPAYPRLGLLLLAALPVAVISPVPVASMQTSRPGAAVRTITLGSLPMATWTRFL
jgi:UDP-N-acetylmuramyl pentapeptide phosphotransferase/UDP-N-acetylglucosamine-1-phosphate transferase